MLSEENAKLLNELCLNILHCETTDEWGATTKFMAIIENLKKNNKAAFSEIINAKTKAGYSLIYYAVKTGNASIFSILQEDANLKEKYDDLTLRDIIRQRNHTTLSLLIDEELKKAKIEWDATRYEKQTKKEDGSQAWIIAPIMRVGFEKKSEGYCFGVANMGAQAILLEDRDDQKELVHFDNFVKRVNLLDQERGRLYQYIENAKHKRILLVEKAKAEVKEPEAPQEKKKWQREIDNMVDRQLSDIEKKYLEMEPFLNGVEVYQQIYQHPDLYPHTRTQHHVAGMELVPNIELEKNGGAVTADYFMFHGEDGKFLQLLRRIKDLADNGDYNAPIVLQLSENMHSITIAYDPIKNGWINVDANRPKKMKSGHTDEEIAKLVEEQLSLNNYVSMKQIRVAILSTAARADEIHRKIIKPLHNSDIYKSNILKLQKEKESFFKRHKKAFLVVGGILLGAALIVGGVFSGGILPAVVLGVAGVTVAVGSSVLGATTSIFDYFDQKKSSKKDVNPDENYLQKQHLEMATKQYEKQQLAMKAQQDNMRIEPANKAKSETQNTTTKQVLVTLNQNDTPVTHQPCYPKKDKLNNNTMNDLLDKPYPNTNLMFDSEKRAIYLNKLITLDPDKQTQVLESRKIYELESMLKSIHNRKQKGVEASELHSLNKLINKIESALVQKLLSVPDEVIRDTLMRRSSVELNEMLNYVKKLRDLPQIPENQNNHDKVEALAKEISLFIDKKQVEKKQKDFDSVTVIETGQMGVNDAVSVVPALKK